MTTGSHLLVRSTELLVYNVADQRVDWIPDYLHPDTQAALRVEMEKPGSQHDVPGYIYTFEIRGIKVR